MQAKDLLITLMSIFLVAGNVFSKDDTVLFIGTNGKITAKDNAIYKQVCSTTKNSLSVQTFMLQEGLWERISAEQYKMINDSTWQIKNNMDKTGPVIRTYKKQADGRWVFRDEVKGQQTRTGMTKTMIPLQLDGDVIEYYTGGTIKSKSVYKDNELISNENWLENGDRYIDNIFYSVDSEPTFNAGAEVLCQHLLAGFNNASIDVSHTLGSIVVGFVVMENGTIDGIRILKGLGTTINDVACNSFFTLILKGNWTPATLNDKTVRYFKVFPINFKPDPNKENVAKVSHDIMGGAKF